MKSVGVFVNVENMYFNIGHRFGKRKLDYKKYLEKAASCGDTLHRAFAYGVQTDAIKFADYLKHCGYEAKFKTYREADSELAFDIFQLIDKIDVIVIGTSNTRIGIVLDILQQLGKECIIFGCTGSRFRCKSMDISEDMLETINDPPITT